MSSTRRALLVSAGAAGLAAASAPAWSKSKSKAGPARQASAGPEVARLNAVLARTTEELLAEFPENATFRGVDTGARAGLKSRLTDRSDAGAARRAAAAKQRFDLLRKIDRKRLGGLDAVNYDVVFDAHRQAVEGARFSYGDDFVLNALGAESNAPYAVTQMTGNFQVIPDFLDSMHVVATRADAEAYLARLQAYAVSLDQESVRLKADAGRGVTPPAFMIDNIVGQLSGYRAGPVAGWGLVTSLARRTGEKAIAGDWAAKAQALCEKEVGPALDRQIAALKALRPTATDDAGVWKLPDGEAYYAWQLDVGTTTRLTAAELHRMGVEQTAELEARMDELLKAQGLTQGTVGARMTALGKDPRFLFPATDEGRAQLIAYLNGRIAAIRPRLANAFTTQPKANMVVTRVPPEIQDGAANGYSLDGTIDGSRPATYYINLKDMAAWPRFTLPSLTFHEGVPGHVWQGDYASRLPLLRALLQANAYVEGWALYAEQLADELGMYDDDPFGRLGYLQSIQFRACRLVVDTGLHAQRWSREQAIAYLVEHTGRAESAMRGEVDRYCATPGQACGYKVGHSEINRLRDKARAALGPRFDLKGFNETLVLSGSAPLTVLGQVVDAWVRGQGAA